jgi:hypothetical protein
MTILITIIQSAFLAEPLKIIVSSCISFKLNQVIQKYLSISIDFIIKYKLIDC